MKCLGILMIASCLGNWMDSSSFETSYSFFFFFFFFYGLARRGEKSSLFLQHSQITGHSKGIVTISVNVYLILG